METKYARNRRIIGTYGCIAQLYYHFKACANKDLKGRWLIKWVTKIMAYVIQIKACEFLILGHNGNSKRENLRDPRPSPSWPSKASRLSSLQFQFNIISPTQAIYAHVESDMHTHTHMHRENETILKLESNLSEWQGFSHDDLEESISSFVGLWRG